MRAVIEAYGGPTFPDGRPPMPDPSAGFVYAEGDSFYLRGKPFRHVGANVHRLLYARLDDEVRRTLDVLEASGIRHVRFSVANDAYTPDEIIGRLSNLLAELSKRELFATLVLATTWLAPIESSEGRDGFEAMPPDPANPNTRGDRKEPSWCPPDDRPPEAPQPQGFFTRYFAPAKLCQLDDCWVESGYTRNYLPFISTIVKAFRDHPAIFAWDVTNEQNTRGGVDLVDTLVRFYTTVARHIKSIDPNHMVTTGLICTGEEWSGMRDKPHGRQIYVDRVSKTDPRPLYDYVCVHEYDYDNEHAEFDDIWRANERDPEQGGFFKPVVVEEVGMLGARDDFSLMEDYFGKLFDGLTWRGQYYGPVDAVLQWGADVACEFGQDWGSGDRYRGPCQQGRITEYRDLWSRWAGELDRRNGGIDARLKLVQSVWHEERSGLRQWTRRIPMTPGGEFDFGGIRGWVPTAPASRLDGSVRRYDLPGSGRLLSHEIQPFPRAGEMDESIWRAGADGVPENWTRTVPLNGIGDTPRWRDAQPWRKNATELPVAGVVVTQSGFVAPNGQTLFQYHWIPDRESTKEWWRTVPIGMDGRPNWGEAAKWRVGLRDADLPRGGALQSEHRIVYANGRMLRHSIWKGGQGIFRNVAFLGDGSAPDWSESSPWYSAGDASTLPGAGPLVGFSTYYTRL